MRLFPDVGIKEGMLIFLFKSFSLQTRENKRETSVQSKIRKVLVGFCSFQMCVTKKSLLNCQEIRVQKQFEQIQSS